MSIGFTSTFNGIAARELPILNPGYRPPTWSCHPPPRHPDHPATRLDLAPAVSAGGTMNRESEAEALYRDALAMRRRILDPSHPELLATMSNLAVLRIKDEV